MRWGLVGGVEKESAAAGADGTKWKQQKQREREGNSESPTGGHRSYKIPRVGGRRVGEAGQRGC